MDKSREASTLSDKLDESWAQRTKDAEDWNRRLASGEIQPTVLQKAEWAARSMFPDSKRFKKDQDFRARFSYLEAEWRESTGIRTPSIAWALNDTFGWHFWAGGLFKVNLLASNICII